MGTPGRGKEEDWKRDSSPRAIRLFRVGREQERRVRSPGWRQGANQHGCYSPPEDLFKGLRLLRGLEQILVAGVVWAGALSGRRPLPGGWCLQGSEVSSPLPGSPKAGKGMLTDDRPLGERVAPGAMAVAPRTFLSGT